MAKARRIGRRAANFLYDGSDNARGFEGIFVLGLRCSEMEKESFRGQEICMGMEGSNQSGLYS
jgi:hypothetical protein